MGTWVHEVLTGTDDRWFEGSKNPWGSSIAPDKVGGKTAPVIELRQLGTTFAQQTQFDLLNDPEALAHYLRDIFLAHRMLTPMPPGMPVRPGRSGRPLASSRPEGQPPLPDRARGSGVPFFPCRSSW